MRPMTDEQEREAFRLLEAKPWRGAEVELASILAEVQRNSETPEGRAGLAEYAADYAEAIQGLRIEIARQSAEQSQARP